VKLLEGAGAQHEQFDVFVFPVDRLLQSREFGVPPERLVLVYPQLVRVIGFTLSLSGWRILDRYHPVATKKAPGVVHDVHTQVHTVKGTVLAAVVLRLLGQSGHARYL
jgi:hypothetical protein